MQKLKEIFKNIKKKEIKKLYDNQYYLYYLIEFSLLNTNLPLLKLEYYIYNMPNNEWIIAKIDVTFEKDIRDKKGINYSEEIIKKRNKHINDELAIYPFMRNNILVLKLLLNSFDMNSTYDQGISSYILTLLYDNSVKMFKNYFDNNNHGVHLLLFLNKFSKYQYNLYIDKNGIDRFLTDKEKDYFVIKNPKYGNNKRFYVDDPVLIEHSNVASPCYDTENVKKFFSWLFEQIIGGKNITQILYENYLRKKNGLPSLYALNK
jgi:hypothetical protein